MSFCSSISSKKQTKTCRIVVKTNSCSFFGRIHSLTICFPNYLTFSSMAIESYVKILRVWQKWKYTLNLNNLYHCHESNRFIKISNFYFRLIGRRVQPEHNMARWTHPNTITFSLEIYPRRLKQRLWELHLPLLGKLVTAA